MQATHQATPLYTVVDALGPPHHRTFHVELTWNSGKVRGEGRTIKAAEAEAARAALAQMEGDAATVGGLTVPHSNNYDVKDE